MIINSFFSISLTSLLVKIAFVGNQVIQKSPSYKKYIFTLFTMKNYIPKTIFILKLASKKISLEDQDFFSFSANQNNVIVITILNMFKLISFTFLSPTFVCHFCISNHITSSGQIAFILFLELIKA